jgi:hypothetical protein
MARSTGNRRATPRQAARPGAASAPYRAGNGWPLALAGVALAAVLVYANSLGNGFVWDDPIIIERQLVVFDSLKDVLITPRGIPQYSPDYYRPTTTASYLIDRWLGGDATFVFHLSVVLAHALAAVLVTLLCRQLMDPLPASDRAAVAAGLLFAVHPVHTESVAWAAGRSDVLATLFTLAALLLLRGTDPGVRRIVASGVCAFAALGAKEVAVALYPLALLRDWTDPTVGLKLRTVGRYAGIGAALVVYVVLRRITIGDVVGEQPGEASAFAVLPELLWALGAYVRELLWPFPLNAYIDTVPRGAGSILGLAALAAASSWAVFQWRHADRRWLFAVAWIALTIAPSLTILWKIPEVPMAERYAYLPSVGLCALFALVLVRTGLARSPLRTSSVAPLLLLAAAAVWMRNPVWRDDVRLWSDTVNKTAVSGMAWRNLGAAHLRAGRDGDAEPLLRHALTLRNPPLGLHGIYSNLGTIKMNERQFATARVLYEQALREGAAGADVIFNLGLSIFYEGGQSLAAARAALPHFDRAAELSPHDPDIDAVLVQVYAVLGEPGRARRHLEAAISKGLRPETRGALEGVLRGSE